MGCQSSKDAQVPTTTTTTTTTKSTTTAGNTIEKTVAGVLEGFHDANTSVMDQISLAKQMVVQNTTATAATIANKARHLQIIFATPLDFLDSATYQAPYFDKTPAEQDFIRKAILQNFVFSNIAESLLHTMIMAFEEVSLEPNATIITQGDVGDYFYVIKHGAVQFLVNSVPVPNLATAGQTFGELALLYHAPRAATCVVAAAVPQSLSFYAMFYKVNIDGE